MITILNDNKPANQGYPAELIVKMTAHFTGTIGYGDVYKCKIAEVIKGNLDENEITVTILANDKANQAFISSLLDTVELEMGCSKRSTDEPYLLMPISGFVDKNRTSWEIEYLKKASS